MFSSKVAPLRGTVLLKEVPGLALMWLGIAGAAITLFANLLAPLDMADWAWWIVQNWQEATQTGWDRLGGWMRLEVPSSLVPPLTLGGMLLVTGIGVRMRDGQNVGAASLSFPLLYILGGTAALAAIGFVIVAGAPQSSSAAGATADAPLVIFLAAAAAGFSPVFAGRGNFIKRLWFIVAGVVILLGLNELTKLGSTS